MNTKLTLALVALITSSALAAIPKVLPEFKNEKQLAEWRAEMAAKAESEPSKLDVRRSTLDVPPAFYTGKPYIQSTGSYAFKCRNYNPELARWTSEDPSGFPDGANCFSYVNNRTSSYFDFMGLTGKSVLWVTLADLYGNGNLTQEGFNYMADFNSNYEGLETEMTNLDAQSAGTSYPTNYLSDGDLFDKRVVTSNSDFTSAANGYTKVFYITHGNIYNGQYTFVAPDGLYHPMSYFDNFWDSTSVIMLSCHNGYTSPANQGNGSIGIVYWSDAISDARWQTRNYLYE